MEHLIPSFIRVVRHLDDAAGLLALFPEFESKPSAVRAEDRVRLLDFPYSSTVFTTWDRSVHCKPELAVFDPAPNQTCGEYLNVYQHGMGVGTNLLNPDDTLRCRVCQYTTGGDYLRTLNLREEHYGWRNAGIVVVFVVGIYGLVFLMMKLRTKATKKAED